MLVSLLLLASSISAPADGCQAFIPAALASRLEVEHPDHRIPRGDDTSCRMDKPRDCLLAESGDFNGDGKADYAVVMPSRNDKDPPLFFAALATEDGWQIHQFRMGTSPLGPHLFLATLPPNAYHETPAVLPTGVTPRSVTTKTDGIMLASCETWATGYFLLGREWFSMALTD